MSWVFIAIAGYFLNAVAILVDKFLLTKRIGEPVTYTFFVSILSLLVLALWPFNYVKPSFELLAYAFPAGLAFAAGLFFLFTALHSNDASRIGPLVGGLTTMFALFFSILILNDQLVFKEFIGIFFLVAGSIVLAFSFKGIFKLNLWPALTAAFFFGLSAVLTKYLFLRTSFITGLVLTRLGTASGGFLLLLVPSAVKAIKTEWQGSRRPLSLTFVLGQSAGALAAILISYAISLANVSVVTALQGLQHVFIFLLAVFLSYFTPKIISEELSSKILALKILSIILISLGLVFVV